MTDSYDLFKIDRNAISVVDLNHSKKEDTRYWLSKTPSERFAALEFLRQQFYSDDANSQRLQRFLEVVKLAGR